MQVEINLERPQEAVIHFHIRDNRWAAVLPVKSLTRLPHSVVHQPVSYRNGPARWQ
jgi:hypothetical protein